MSDQVETTTPTPEQTEHPKNYTIRCKIDNMKIPADKWYVGKKSVSLSFSVTPRREPDEYGNTHSISIYDTVTQKKTYIGEGQIQFFDNSNVDKTKLPPTIPGGADQGVSDAIIDDGKNPDDLPF